MDLWPLLGMGFVSGGRNFGLGFPAQSNSQGKSEAPPGFGCIGLSGVPRPFFGAGGGDRDLVGVAEVHDLLLPRGDPGVVLDLVHSNGRQIPRNVAGFPIGFTGFH